MKFFSTIAVALTAVTGVTALTPGQLCQRDHSIVFATIRNFCEGVNSLDVPTNYASVGARSPPGSMRSWTVSIDATCRPKQWVPKQYCYSQFYDMCPHVRYQGARITRKYGNNNCQTWSILNAWIYRRDEGGSAGNGTAAGEVIEV